MRLDVLDHDLVERAHARATNWGLGLEPRRRCRERWDLLGFAQASTNPVNGLTRMAARSITEPSSERCRPSSRSKCSMSSLEGTEVPCQPSPARAAKYSTKAGISSGRSRNAKMDRNTLMGTKIMPNRLDSDISIRLRWSRQRYARWH